jgi:beta-lactamase regulating signal transducer with metallopeptidase domain
MTSVTEFILNFLVNATWQIAAIFLLATVGSYVLKNCSAHYRHLIWTTALFVCLCAPLLTATQILTSRSQVIPSAPQIAVENGDDIAPVEHTRRSRSSQVVVNTEPRNIQLIAAAYFLFLGLCVFRFMRLWMNKERLRRSVTFDALTSPVETSLKCCMNVFGIRNVQLGRSQTARVPYTLGIRRPLIVLPDSFCGDVDHETLVSVIAHEMAHVRRRDFLTKLVCELVSLPIAFHPLTFLIKRQIERERELACDELVTQRMLQPETYARSLLRAADLSIMPTRRSVMLSVFDGRMLEERIRLLLHKQFSMGKWSGRLIITAVLGVLCLSSVLGSAFGFSFGTPKGTKNASPPPAVVESRNEPAPGSNTAQDPKDTNARRRSVPVDQAPQELAQTACDAGRSRTTEAIPSLVAMLGDDRPTEPIACYTNGNWSPALDTFKRPSPGEQAALALASMGRAALPALINELDNASATTRRNAAWAIGELTNMPPGERAPAVPQLITLLRDSDAWVRMAAARAIGEVRDRRASDTLISTLSDADWRVRRLAAWALNEMKEPRAVAALCQLLLGDERAEVRRAAAEALGEIASAEALPSLQQALDDPESAVRAKVSWAIAEIEDN